MISQRPSICAALQRLFTMLSALDPALKDEFTRLRGKVIGVRIESAEPAGGSGVSFYLLPGPEGMEVRDAYDGKPDVMISGTLPALARMGLGEKGEGLFQGDVTIVGDTGVAQRLQEILRAMDPDFEGLLAKVTGDIAARQATVLVKALWVWSRQASRDLPRDLGETLSEEWRLIVPPLELEAFGEDVDRLRDDVDRLQARLSLLERRS